MSSERTQMRVNIPPRALGPREIRAGCDLVEYRLGPLPETREGCPERPCPYLRCKYHLASDVRVDGTLLLPWGNPPDLAAMEYTCALDVADSGGATLDGIGRAMNLSRERVRQLEVSAVDRTRRSMIEETKMQTKIEETKPKPKMNQLDRLDNEDAVRAMERAVEDASVSPKELFDELRGLGVETKYRTVWGYLRRRRSGAEANGRPRGKSTGGRPRGKSTGGRPTGSKDAGGRPTGSKDAVVGEDRAVEIDGAPRTGYVVRRDGTILAPTARAAVEVAILIRGKLG